MSNLLYPITTASKMTDKVIVLFSGGKDSVVTLDLCRRYFNSVDMVFMYYVKGLSFQEKIIRYYERLYDLKCHRIPHFELSEMLRYGLFRPCDFAVPVVKTVDTYNYARVLTGKYWIAGGERINDSMVRRAMIKNSGSIDEKRGRFYPVSNWSKKDILDYIKKNRLRISEESSVLGFSFRSFGGKDLAAVKEHYPQDYEKIIDWFPFAQAGIIREENRGKDKTSEI